jgi:hypothetical protein
MCRYTGKIEWEKEMVCPDYYEFLTCCKRQRKIYKLSTKKIKRTLSNFPKILVNLVNLATVPGSGPEDSDPLAD